MLLWDNNKHETWIFSLLREALVSIEMFSAHDLIKVNDWNSCVLLVLKAGGHAPVNSKLPLWHDQDKGF